MGKTLTKTDLAARLVDQIGLNRAESRELVDALLGEISAALCAGEDVRLWGFGNFILRDKSARPGRNPRNGEETVIVPRRVVTFRPGQKLRKQVEGHE